MVASGLPDVKPGFSYLPVKMIKTPVVEEKEDFDEHDSVHVRR